MFSNLDDEEVDKLFDGKLYCGDLNKFFDLIGKQLDYVPIHRFVAGECFSQGKFNNNLKQILFAIIAFKKTKPS